MLCGVNNYLRKMRECHAKKCAKDHAQKCAKCRTLTYVITGERANLELSRSQQKCCRMQIIDAQG